MAFEYMNKIAFDRSTKDYVKITNGICSLPHDTPEHFKETHEKGIGSCTYVPHEAIALRVIGVSNGKPIIAWTYIGVEFKNLDFNVNNKHMNEMFDVLMSKRSVVRV